MLRTPSLTDVEQILVGHYTLRERPTGCTVVTAPRPFVAGIDVRGGAPGTRETELLKPANSVDRVDAILTRTEKMALYREKSAAPEV